MSGVLIDKYKRKIEYIRVSVTDKCDLRCFYCLPKGYKDFNHVNNRLSIDELCQIIRAFADLGVSKVRLTGGEPLVRKDIIEIAERMSAINGIKDLSLSTNATLLDKYARGLKSGGIGRINVSLDSLQPERFFEISGGRLDKVLSGLMAAKAAGLKPIKINMVMMRGINDDETEAMLEFCIKHDFTLRFIETMPISDCGRQASEHYIDLQEIKTRIQKNYELIPSAMLGAGPARYYQIVGTNLRIGFITPVSQHFCDTCNRVRLSAEGDLNLCLGHENKVELRPLLRNGISHTALMQKISAAIALKPRRHEFRENPQKIVRFMAKIGG